MIIRNSRFMKQVELWFDEAEPTEKFDVIIRRQHPTRVRGGVNEPFVTMLIDLELPSEEIFSNVHRNTRSKINKAIKEDELSFDVVLKPTAAQLGEFVEFYNAFAESKSLEKIWEPHLAAILDAGMLAFSRVSQGGQHLVWHALILQGQRVGVIHSASHFRDASPDTRNVVGRANRYLHWQEMLSFKASGFKTYDLCGWYAGTTDESLLMVNRFKEEFGGIKTHEFNSIEDRSARAKLIAWFKKTFAKTGHQHLQTRDVGA
ncbi:hypothetical protein BH09PSE5_BH09PSE5_41300 [soil metagenome]